MVDDKEVEDFLEHFGVKGMRWGVRNKRDERARARQFGGKKTEAEKSRRRKQLKVAGAVTAVAAVAAGAVVANSMMKQYGGIKIKAAPKPPSNSGFNNRDIFRMASKAPPPSGVFRTKSGAIPMGPIRSLKISGSTKIKDIPRGAKITDMTPELQTRVRSIQSTLRNRATPESLGIWKPNI